MISAFTDDDIIFCKAYLVRVRDKAYVYADKEKALDAVRGLSSSSKPGMIPEPDFTIPIPSDK